MAEFESSSLVTVLSTCHSLASTPRKRYWGLHRTAVCYRAQCGRSNPEVHVPCRLSVGAQNCTKNGGRPDLKLTLFLVENGANSRPVLLFTRHRSQTWMTPSIAPQLECITERDSAGRTGTAVFLASSRLRAQNCTKNVGRPDLKLTLLLVENGWVR